MKEVSSNNFGILIAYLVPGFTVLWGVSFFSETVKTWLTGASVNGPTIGGFLYVTLAAVAAGLTVSTIRWAVLDTLHHRTGIRRPTWDFARLEQHISAYRILEDNHYKFYQFYGAMLFAVLFTWMSWRLSIGVQNLQPTMADVAATLMFVVFYAGSRDTLRRYYERTTQLLCSSCSNSSGFAPEPAAAHRPHSPPAQSKGKASDLPSSRPAPPTAARYIAVKRFVHH